MKKKIHCEQQGNNAHSKQPAKVHSLHSSLEDPVETSLEDLLA